ncbi:hypothetical protein A2Z00_02380 [Candidatus Gottesmanbacteria bacterium RBG_13_45_10]|uniref:Sucrose phosphatase-like domain-containing protein n=1 Tax=Candidatus Gottesmanbacteria bacterium RBG_13_45_10 TaxID=1798370 RepID=A0A1F5ZGP5_9BACT|nr:MAG: hypothetical protein A2Z00_02380 [Candidatus Gottesmanbacteria bacterium RBG_13_45_10]
MQYSSKIPHPMLAKAKRQGVRMIASDIDWTIRDPNDARYDMSSAQQLCSRIMKRGIYTLILTGRDASFQRDFVPGIRTFLKKNSMTLPLYAGCANGGSLYEISAYGIQMLYLYGLADDEVDSCISIVSKSMDTLHLHRENFQPQGITVFIKFLSTSWNGIIPTNLLAKAKKFKGIVFCEKSKVSFVLPKNPAKSDALLSGIRTLLPKRYSVKTDQEYGHITRARTDDGKLIDKSFALQYVCKTTRTTLAHVVIFGGVLDEIDRRMLTRCPYGFTNQKEYTPINPGKPPFKLNGKTSPVALVHEAISYLINE